MWYPMAQTVSEDIENTKVKNETIKEVLHLYEQLRELLTNPHKTTETNSPKSILSCLTRICSRLVYRKCHYAEEDTVDINEILLIGYLELLDMNSFVDIIVKKHAPTNNGFLRWLVASFNDDNTLDAIDEMADKLRQKIYSLLLDRLSSSTRVVAFLQNQYNDNANQILVNTCGLVLIIFLRILMHLEVRLISMELGKYQKTLVNPMITFIDTYFMTKTSSANDPLINQMLRFLHDTTDKTIPIPIFLNADCPQACLRWLVLPFLNRDQYDQIIGIIWNIARHDDGAKALKKYDCTEVLLQFESEILDTKIEFMLDKDLYVYLKKCSWMTILLLYDSNLWQSEAANKLIISELIPTTLAASRSLTLRVQTFDLSELLIILMKLFTYDPVVTNILHQDHFPNFFSSMLKRFLSYLENGCIDENHLDSDVVIIIALANILWSISFHNQYKENVIRDVESIKRLEKFRTSSVMGKVVPNIYIPHHMASFRRAMDGIWENLYPSSSPKLSIQPSNPSLCSLMISYSHVDIDFCRQLFDIFESKIPELSIHVDINSWKYLWKEIVRTIEQSDMVLFLISEDYFKSKSCRQELIYVTDTLNKRFIPVFIDSNYQATGWLADRITGVKQIRFGKSDFIETCNELMSIINQLLGMNIPSISAGKKPSYIKHWNDSEVKQLFTNNNIMPELYEFYRFQNGNELLLYAQAILKYPWTNEYERIKSRFEEKFPEQKLSVHQFLKFIHVLERL